MSRILYKRVLPQYLKTWKRNVFPQRCLGSFDKHNKLNKSLFKAISPSPNKITWRTICTSNSYKQSSNEPTPDFENDEEFQNILKDFANDFNVNVESEGEILEEIKKSMNEPEVGDPSSIKKEKSVPSNSPELDVAGKKFKQFSESDSVVIPSQEEVECGDFTEEEITFHVDDKWKRDTSQAEHERGISGVFDVEPLVSLMRKENLVDIAVISIPKELQYANFLVLVTAMSPRHSKAVVEHIIKTYKKKKHPKDPFLRLEGEKTGNWKCLDMGNIVLHIFLEETRAFYDIESLWLFDQDFDSGGTLKSDPIFDTLEEQLAFFNSLQNSTSTEPVKEVS